VQRRKFIYKNITYLKHQKAICCVSRESQKLQGGWKGSNQKTAEVCKTIGFWLRGKRLQDNNIKVKVHFK